jgi:hypothetical protein
MVIAMVQYRKRSPGSTPLVVGDLAPGFATAAVIRALLKWITERSKDLSARFGSRSLTIVPVVPTWTVAGRDDPHRR